MAVSINQFALYSVNMSGTVNIRTFNAVFAEEMAASTGLDVTSTGGTGTNAQLHINIPGIPEPNSYITIKNAANGTVSISITVDNAVVASSDLNHNAVTREAMPTLYYVRLGSVYLMSLGSSSESGALDVLMDTAKNAIMTILDDGLTVAAGFHGIGTTAFQAAEYSANEIVLSIVPFVVPNLNLIVDKVYRPDYMRSGKQYTQINIDGQHYFASGNPELETGPRFIVAFEEEDT